MLDKDDEEEAEDGGEVNGRSPEKKEEYIDEDKMLDIAEKCFMRIADAILGHGINVREAFKKHISTPSGGDEYISPQGFLEGVKSLGIADLS
jgi:hypothetical protein